MPTPDRQARLRRGEFAKYHALGNDYIVVDEASFGARMTAARVRALCDRHTGIGGDGVLLRCAPRKKADFGLRIFNPDGSEAPRSGNGLRICAHFLWTYGYTRRESFSLWTRSGTVRAELQIRSGAPGRIRVEMGRASFSSGNLPALGVEREMVAETLVVAGRPLRVTGVSVGNPHCVVFVDELDRDDLRRLGPLIENHRVFPIRTNVQFARVKSKERIDVLIWERGAGETQASGTSACAVAAAAHKLGRVGSRVRVCAPGGELRVEIGDDKELRMTGPARPVYRGRWLA